MRARDVIASMGGPALLAAAVIALQAQGADRLTLPRDVSLNQRQPPEFVLKTIGIRPGMVVGEVGAGWGRYTVQIASRVGPGGRVYANDIDRDALETLRRRCAELGFENVEVVAGAPTETRLPDRAMDIVVMVNVVHCLADPVALLKNVGASLKPGAQVAVVEGNLDKNPGAAGEWLPRARLLDLFEKAGYTLAREDASLPQDNIYLFAKHASAGNAR
ncbi:MAG: ubiE 8 [Acidobacteria bacterium]|nr:ubiE 8 [Acidobacteriota bacterium]